MDRASFSETPAPLADADVIVLCLPTPLTDGAPDLTMVLTAAEDVARFLTPGVLVVLESTTYPGTTEELLRPILEESGLAAGRDFALGYSPRAHRSRATASTGSTPPRRSWRASPTGAASSRSRSTRRSSTRVVTTSTPREAEMAKLIENTYRQVNIALVNELAVLARDLGVDIWESLHAAATKPFGYQAFWPGPGVGGHCIAIDPTYLSWRAGQQLGYRVGVHRACERGQQPHARLRGLARRRGAQRRREADQGLHGARGRRRVQARRRRPAGLAVADGARATRPARGRDRLPRHVRAAMRDRRRTSRDSLPLDADDRRGATTSSCC